MGSSAFGAHLLDGRRHANSSLKIPPKVHEENTCTIDENSVVIEELRRPDLTIKHEFAVGDQFSSGADSLSCQYILHSNLPFGTIVVYYKGDFPQGFPVV